MLPVTQLIVGAAVGVAGAAEAGPGKSLMLLGLNPGAEYGPAKRWPAERFVEAARGIQQRTNCAWLIFGDPTGHSPTVHSRCERASR